MKALKFAEFYHLREKNGHSYYDNAIGDRSVLILDGRKINHPIIIMPINGH